MIVGTRDEELGRSGEELLIAGEGKGLGCVNELNRVRFQEEGDINLPSSSVDGFLER